MRRDQIGIIQMCMLLTMAMGLVNHVTIIPLLLSTANKDSWLSVVIAVPLCAIWTLVPYYTSKLSKQADMAVWLKENVHGSVAWAFVIILALYLYMNALICLKEVVSWTKVTYLPQTPVAVTALVLLVLCIYASAMGIRTIAISAGVLLPFVWLLGYFVMSSNFQIKRYSLLLPMFSAGTKAIAESAAYAFSSLVELFVVVLLQQHVKGTIKWYHLLILVAIMANLTLGPLMGAIAAFGFASVELRYPAYEQWRLVQIGRYVSHVDFLSIYQWISGAFIRVALALYLLVALIKPKTERRKLVWYGAIGTSQLLFVVFPLISDNTYMRIVKLYYFAVIWTIVPVSFVLLGLVLFKSRKRGAQS